MSNYTKGPWIVKEQPVKHLGFYIQQDGFRESQRAFIGECGGGTQDFKEIKANAYVMAAAPEMLEALNEVFAWVGEFGIKSEIYDKVKVAIAKAVQP